MMITFQVYQTCEPRVDILNFFFVKNPCSSIISMEVWHRVHTSSKQFVTDENLHHVPQFVQFKM